MFTEQSSQQIDKMSAILVALEMINNLTTAKSTRDDIQSTRDYVYSIEDVIPFDIILELYQLIANIEIYKHKLDKQLK